MLGEGAYLLIGLLLLASLLLASLPLLALSLALALVALISSLWGRYCLAGVEYRRRFSQTRAFFGEEIELTIEVVNRKPLPLAWLEVEDELPAELSLLQGRTSVSHKPARVVLANLFALRWYERVRRRYRLRCDARGYHAFGPAVLRSGDLFGFVRRELTVEAEDHLLVYPRVVPLGQLGLPAADPFGDRHTRQWLFVDPQRSVGVREYTPGDSPRRIHWQATARTQRLQVKLFEPTTTHQVVVFLNLNTFGDYWWWLGFNRDLLELSVTVAASLASWAVEHGYQLGLCANGNARLADQTVSIAPSRDPRQLTQVLEALARVLPFATVPLPELLREGSRRLPYGATLAVVTAMLDAETVAELRALRAVGHRIALLLVGDDAPRFNEPGFTVHRLGGASAWRDLTQIAPAGGKTA